MTLTALKRAALALGIFVVTAAAAAAQEAGEEDYPAAAEAKPVAADPSWYDELKPYGLVLGMLVLAGFGAPYPEELPIIIGGGLVGNAWYDHPAHPHWFIMIPVIIFGVIVSDLTLYLIGRWGGARLLRNKWLERKFLPPDKRDKIEENFHKYGIRILLFARLMPGIRGSIFVMAGMTRVPLRHFWIADGIYAIPGVNLIFWLSFWFADRFRAALEAAHDRVDRNKPLITLAVLAAVGGVIIYNLLRRKVSTGDPADLPPIVKQAAQLPHLGGGEMHIDGHPLPSTSFHPTPKLGTDAVHAVPPAVSGPAGEVDIA